MAEQRGTRRVQRKYGMRRLHTVDVVSAGKSKGLPLADPSGDWNSRTLENEKLQHYFHKANQSPIPHIHVEKTEIMSQSSAENGLSCQSDDLEDEVWTSRSVSYQQEVLSTEFTEKCRTKHEKDKRYKSRFNSDSVVRSPALRDANANEHKIVRRRHTTSPLPSEQKSFLVTESPSPSPKSPSQDSGKNVRFTFGPSDSGSDNDLSDSKCKPPRSPAPKDSREARKQRFRKMLQPLRRSHSAASTKDIPAHALFLKKKNSADSMSGDHKLVKKSSAGECSSAKTEFDEVDMMSRKKKSSISKNMKQKLQFLRRRNTDSVLVQPSLENIQSWGRSFDNLLYDKYGLALFRGFLRTEFSDENIDFWIACEEYRSCVKTSKLNGRAQQIYSEFVAVQSPREVNLDSKTRLSAIQGISNPDRSTFDHAQHRIQALMEKDSYPRFLRSEVYQKLLKGHQPMSPTIGVATSPATAKAVLS